MSRGGRGGARGGGRAGGPDISFDLDGDLDDLLEYNKLRNGGVADPDDWTSVLYPPMAPPRRMSPTPEDRRFVQGYREMREARRNGPFFIDVPVTGKRDKADFNAFEDVATYGNKRIKRNRGMPNLKKVPFTKELMPKELWSVFTDEGDDEDEETPAPKKDLNFLKKKRLDRLAQFDEGADDTGAADAEDDEANEEEGEEGIEVPEDDSFSETDNDDGDDYNAEKYFDNDMGPDEDGDEGGGDDAW